MGQAAGSAREMARPHGSPLPWHHTIQPNPSALPLSVVTTTDPGAPAILRVHRAVYRRSTAPAGPRAGARGAPPPAGRPTGAAAAGWRSGSTCCPGWAAARAPALRLHRPRRSCLYLTVATQKRKPARMDGPAFLASAGGAAVAGAQELSQCVGSVHPDVASTGRGFFLRFLVHVCPRNLLAHFG